jgi:hypothetical protein
LAGGRGGPAVALSMAAVVAAKIKARAVLARIRS